MGEYCQHKIKPVSKKCQLRSLMIFKICKTYTAAGTSPLIPIRSLSDGGNARPNKKKFELIVCFSFLIFSKNHKNKSQ